MIVDLYHTFETHVLALLFCAARMTGFFATALLFSQAAMTRIGRNALIVVLCIPLVPLVHPSVESMNLQPGLIVLMIVKEYVIGFFLGYTVGWIFWAVQSAGALIDNQRGASIAESIDPLQGHQSSPLGNLFSQAMMVYMFIIGGVLFFIDILYQSFLLWPISNFFPLLSPQFPVLILSIFDTAMRFAFVLAAPVVAIMFLAEMSLALISRFAPQIQVFILAMPIKSGLAIFILILYAIVLFPEAAKQRGPARIFALKLFETFSEPINDPFAPDDANPIRGAP
jgi:type III secretion protein T